MQHTSDPSLEKFVGIKYSTRLFICALLGRHTGLVVGTAVTARTPRVGILGQTIRAGAICVEFAAQSRRGFTPGDPVSSACNRFNQRH